MALEITRIRFGSPERNHDTVIAYQWLDHESGIAGDADPLALAERIERGGETAYVRCGTGKAAVGVVLSLYQDPHLRTYADGTWTDDLLTLATF